MSCFYVRARLRVCSSRALSRLRPLFRVGVWCLDPGTHVLTFGSCRGLDTRAPCSVLLCERAVLSSLGRALSCSRVLCCVARSLCISLAACFHVVMFCVNTWLMSIRISCMFVSCFAHGWWFVLLAMCLCFCFVWAHGFVLDFGLPCALMSICLDPTHLVSWLLVHLPHLSFLVTLLICSLYNLLVFAVLCQFVVVCSPGVCLALHCLALPCLALPCLALPCLALPCLALPCLALPCPVLSCPVLSCPILPWQACQLSCFSPTG